MVIRCLLLAGLFGLMVTGCGSSSDVQADITGEWLGQVVKQDLVFHDDGRVEMRGHEHSTYMGRYTFGTGNELTCTFDQMSEPVVCTPSISGDILTLKFPSGREEVYKRK